MTRIDSTPPHIDNVDPAADEHAAGVPNPGRSRSRSLSVASRALHELASTRRPRSAPPSVGRQPVAHEQPDPVSEPVSSREAADDRAVTVRPGASARNGATDGGILRKLDIASLLKLDGTHDDDGFLARVRSVETGPGSLPELLSRLDRIEQKLAGAGFPAALNSTLKAQLKLTKKALQEIETDKHWARRAAMALGPTVVLGTAALAVPLNSNPRQQLFASELFALTSKAMLEGIGMARTRTTGAGLVKDRLMARNYANTLQALEFVLPTFVKPSAHLNRKTWVDLLATVVSTTGLFAGFMGADIKNQFDKRLRGGVDPALRSVGAALNDEQRTALAAIDNDAKALHEAALDMRGASIVGETAQVSPHLGKQIQLVLRACNRLAEMTSHTLTDGDRAVLDSGAARANPDRNAKVALALFTAAVTATTALLTFPDTIGVVDLGSDALFTTILMAVNANNPDMSRHDALEEFKTFAGLSVVLLAVLAANKLGHDFIDHGDRGLAVGATVLSMLNATVPGIVGEKAANAVERALAGASSMRIADLTGPLRALGDLLHRSVFTTAPRPSTATITDVTSDDAGGGHAPA